MKKEDKIKKYKPRKLEFREWLRLVKSKAKDDKLILETDTSDDIKFNISDISAIYFCMKEGTPDYYSPSYAVKLKSTGKFYDVYIKDFGVTLIELPFNETSTVFKRDYGKITDDQEFLTDFFLDNLLPFEYMSLFPNHLDWVKQMKKDQATIYFLYEKEKDRLVHIFRYKDIKMFMEDYVENKLYAIVRNSVFLLDNMRFECSTGFDKRMDIYAKEMPFSYDDYNNHLKSVFLYLPNELKDDTLSDDQIDDNN